MATKKQKRQAGIERHNREMEELRRSGQAALRAARAERFRESLKAWQKQHEDKHFRFIDECPHCQVIQKAIARGRSHKEGVDEVKHMISEVPSVAVETLGIRTGSPEVVFSSQEPMEDRASLEMECA